MKRTSSDFRRDPRRSRCRSVHLQVEAMEGRVLLAAGLVSINAAGTSSGIANSNRPSLSADGRYVVFVSNATDLTATPDFNNRFDVFVRDLATGTTTLVSRNASGTAAGNGICNSALITP